jgi:hypothetical protein
LILQLFAEQGGLEVAKAVNSACDTTLVG